MGVNDVICFSIVVLNGVMFYESGVLILVVKVGIFVVEILEMFVKEN